jgi:hypothetical protein
MPTISLTSLWDETRAYLAREAALLIPVALGTIGLAMVILFLAAPEQQAGKPMPPGPWMVWLIPYFLLLVCGMLALSALAIRPGMSVREALVLAGRRLLPALATLVLLGLAAMALLFLLGRAVAIVGQLVGLGTVQAASLGMMIALPVLLVLAVRFLFFFPAMAAGEGMAGALGASWRLTAPFKWRLLVVWLGFGLVTLLLLATVEFGIGSLMLLVTRAAGDPALGERLVQLLIALLSSLIQLVWLSYVARLYARLAGSINGI